ncbi:MAG: reverse transcriptase domain-containing protein [Terriglobales bacterium]
MIPNLSPMVESWLASGISFPEARRVPASYRENRLLSDSQTATISAQITADVKAGVFMPEPQPWCTSPVFAVAKQGINQWRMVVDLRIVNDAFVDRPFHYENLETVAQLVQYGDFVFTIDLKSAFQQLQLHPNMRRLFGIRWNGVSYVSTVLCFGWKSSPLVWTKLTREVVRLWRSHAIRLAVYLDDFIFMAKTREAAEKLMLYVLGTLWDLGFQVSSKSKLTPTQRTRFLGLELDTSFNPPRWFVPNDKAEKLRAAATTLLTTPSATAARRIAQFAGLLISLMLALEPARMMSRELFFTMRQGSYADWGRLIALQPEAVTELQWWATNLQAWISHGRPVIPMRTGPTITLTVDASCEGWGARLQGTDLHLPTALCTTDVNGSQTAEAQAPWPPAQRDLPQCARELSGVLAALQTFQDYLTGRYVRLRTDNLQVVAHITNTGGHSILLTRIMRDIWQLTMDHEFHLEPEHIPGTLMTEEGVDALSREIPISRDDWMLHPTIFQELDHLWGPCSVDRFASALNVQCRDQRPLRFNSRSWEPNADAIDAFTQSWTLSPHGSREINWCNPPFNLVGRVIGKIIQERATAIVILPLWKAQWWWPIVVEKSHELLPLPHAQDLFFPRSQLNRACIFAPPFAVAAAYFCFDPPVPVEGHTTTKA